MRPGPPWGRFLALACLLAGHAGAQPEFGPRERSVSSSRQFVVYAEDPTVRTVVSAGVEDIKRGVLRVLRVRDAWVHAVVITVRPAAAAEPGLDPVQVLLLSTDAGPKIEVNVRSGPTEQPVSFAREIVRALLTEIAVRIAAEQKPPRLPEPVPDWLVEGVAELTQLVLGQDDRRPDLYRKLLETGRVCSLDSLVRGTSGEFDSATRDIHRGYAAALVQALLDLPDGHAGLWKYLGRTAEEGADPIGVLERSFGSLGDGNSTLEKLWTLSLARLSALDRAHLLNAEQTERALEAALVVTTPGEKGEPELFSLADFGRFIRRKGADEALGDAVKALMRVRLRAHPLYASVVEGYIDTASNLARRKTRGAADRLRKLEADRAGLARLAQDIRDHLDWMEANLPGGESGAFEPYFRAAEALDTARPVRRDNISRYLDAIEAELR